MGVSTDVHLLNWRTKPFEFRTLLGIFLRECYVHGLDNGFVYEFVCVCACVLHQLVHQACFVVITVPFKSESAQRGNVVESISGPKTVPWGAP